MSSTDFEQMVSGLPADEVFVKAQLRADLAAQGSRIANTSPFSPFFVLLGAIFSTPVLYLRGLVLEKILPGLFVGTATGALLDLHAAGMDEARKGPSAAKGNLTFRREGTSGDLAIPQGTVVESPEIDGVIYRLVTTAEGLIPDGSSAGAVPAEAETAGAAWNLGDGYYSILPVPVPGVSGVANEAGWLTEPGRDAETDESLRERLQLKWRRMSGWHTADTYRSLVSEAAGIDPDDVYFDLSSPRGPGSADAYLLMASGLPPATLVAQVNALINDQGQHGLGDDFQVKSMPALPVALEVSVTARWDATAEEKTQLASDVEDLLRAAFRESAAYSGVARVAPFERVSRSALAGHIHGEFGLAEAVDWIRPAADPVPGLELPLIQRATLAAGPAVDKGSGKVGLPAPAHGFAAETRVRIAGTASYDGVHTVDAESSANELVIAAPYTAETFSGAETVTALVVTVA